MYRFYCTVCKKVKRVQRVPRIIQDIENVNPAERIGECNRHSSSSSSFRPTQFIEKKVGR